MGVLKNDVGRPSNKTIMTRRIFKGIILVIILFGCFIFGYKLSIDSEPKSTAIEKYVVTFNSLGGTNVEKQIIKEGNSVKEPTVPEKEGYVFIGWELNGKIFNFNSKITSDCILIAKWQELENDEVVISFNTAGGNTISNIVIEKNTVPKLSIPVKEGFEFLGWYIGNEKYNNTLIKENITLTAKWKEIITTTKKEEKTTSKKEEKTTSKKEEKTTTKKQNIKQYTITFNTNGGNSIPKQLVNLNGKAIKPEIPTKEGFSFVQWNLNDKKYDFNQNVNEDIELIASWKKIEQPYCSNVSLIPNKRVYKNGKYSYTISCYSYHKGDIDLEVYKKNTTGISFINSAVIPENGRISVNVSVSLGETATFLMKSYVKNNNIKEYSKPDTITITAPKENTTTLNLPKLNVTVDSFVDRKGFNMTFVASNNNHYDGVQLAKKTTNATGGPLIEKSKSYYVDYYKLADTYYAYTRNQLYVIPYVNLSNGERFYGPETFVPFNN